MIQKFLFPILVIFIFSSCSLDIDKNISTDLQVEGKEIFNISFTLEEAYFFAFRTLDNYKTADTLDIPGCPVISINEEMRKVTLEFDSLRECSNSASLLRSGKIHIEYLNTNSLESTTRLEYENYKVRDIKVEGRRDFKQVRSLLNPNRRTEVFTDLLLIDEFESSSRINGNYEFQLSFQNGELSEFLCSGSLEGRNITGRPITMNPEANKRYLVNCILSGNYLPNQGSEKWQIFRNETGSTSHTMVYETEPECQNSGKLTLYDSRIMVFEQ
ncbi:hypothetical protein [Shivajiella indica]|uniref:Lipoprotein n=1 Tax=Shivajiella indica TaxID=872115 RepID=A0ABW5B9B9_9BACT